MAEIDGDAESSPNNKKVKFAPCASVIPKLPEEKNRLLRDSLLALDNNVLFCFNLLKIIKSNAEMCVPFKTSFVKIERSTDDSQPEAERTMVYNFAGIFMKGVNILRLYLGDPEKVPEDKGIRIALQRLAQTMLKIEDIEHNLAKKMRSPDLERETVWCISLVHHLLKELSLNQQYRIDMFSKFNGDLHSCCNEPVKDYGQYDDCSLGNSKVWHGNVHVLLGPHSDVAVHAKDSDDAIDTNTHGSLSSFEVEDNSDLINDRSQIIAETIVFAFLQKKNNPAFENYLIPTIGISKKHILFYLYDPEHDILLESPLFNIFQCQSNRLSYPTVLALWFTVNYKMFCTGVTRAMKERNFTADFLAQVDDETKMIYKERLHFRNCGTGTVKSSYFKPFPGEGWKVNKSEPFKTYIQSSR